MVNLWASPKHPGYPQLSTIWFLKRIGLFCKHMVVRLDFEGRAVELSPDRISPHQSETCSKAGPEGDAKAVKPRAVKT